LREYPHIQHENKRVYNVQEGNIVNHVAENVTQIYETIKNQQEDHQALIVELEGIVSK
jgi:hypothetical protein